MLDLEHLLRMPCLDPEDGCDILSGGEGVAFAWNLDAAWEIYGISLAPGGNFLWRHL